MDLASLGIRVDSTSADAGAVALDRLSTAADKAATFESKLATQSSALNASLNKTQSVASATQDALNKIKFDGKSTSAGAVNIRDSFKDMFAQIEAVKNSAVGLAEQEAVAATATGSLGTSMQALALRMAPVAIGIGVVALAAREAARVVYQAELEHYNYVKAIELTGQASAITASQLSSMAVALTDIGVTQGKAADALTQFVVSGQVATKNLQDFAAVALGLERSAGVPIANTVKNFASLGEAPVRAAKDLNAQYHFLTQSTLKQIEALEKQGNVAGAGEMAQRAYLQAMQQRIDGIEQGLGDLQSAARTTANLYDRMWDSITGLFRAPTLKEELVSQLKAARDDLDRIAAGKAFFDEAGFNAAKAKVDELERRVQRLRTTAGDQVNTKQVITGQGIRGGGGIRPTDTGLTLEQAKPTSASNDDKFGSVSLAASLASIKGDLDASSQAYAAYNQVLDRLHKDRLVSDGNYYDARRHSIEEDAAAQEGAVNREIAAIKVADTAAKTRLDSRIDLSVQDRATAENALQVQHIQNEQRIAELVTKRAAIERKASSEVQLNSLDQQSAIRATATAYDEAVRSAQAYLDTLTKQQDRKLSIFGKGDQKREKDSGLAAIEDRYAEQRQQLEREKLRATDADKPKYDVQLAALNEYQVKAIASYDDYWSKLLEKQSDWSVGASEAIHNYFDDANSAAKQSQHVFENAFSGMGDALVKFAETGKLDFKSLASSIIADILRIQAQKLVASAASSLLSLFGGGFGGGGTAMAGGTELTGSTVGFAASGAEVNSGDPFIIGEKGPELFIPRSAGTIVPNNKLGGMGGNTVIVQSENHFSPGVDVAQMSALQDQRDRALELKIVEGIRRGRYGL